MIGSQEAGNPTSSAPPEPTSGGFGRFEALRYSLLVIRLGPVLILVALILVLSVL